MKKLIFIIVALATLTAQAQKKERPIVIIRFGFHSTNVKVNDPDKLGTSAEWHFKYAVETILPIIKMKNDQIIGFNPGISYSKTGYKSENNFLQSSKTSYISLQLPITYFNSGGSSIFLGAGPFINYALSGTHQTVYNAPFTKSTFGNSINDDRKPFDAGLEFKVGKILPDFIAGSKNGILAGLQSNIGLIDLTPNDKKPTAKSYLYLRSFDIYTAIVF